MSCNLQDIIAMYPSFHAPLKVIKKGDKPIQVWYLEDPSQLLVETSLRATRMYTHVISHGVRPFGRDPIQADPEGGRKRSPWSLLPYCGVAQKMRGEEVKKKCCFREVMNPMCSQFVKKYTNETNPTIMC